MRWRGGNDSLRGRKDDLHVHQNFQYILICRYYVRDVRPERLVLKEHVPVRIRVTTTSVGNLRPAESITSPQQLLVLVLGSDTGRLAPQTCRQTERYERDGALTPGDVVRRRSVR